MVKSFMKDAQLGLACTMLRSPGGGGRTIDSHERVPGTFSLDKAMSKMVVQAFQTDNLTKVKVPLIDVQEVYSYEDLTRDVPDLQLRKDLREEDRGTSIFIHYQAV